MSLSENPEGKNIGALKTISLIVLDNITNMPTAIDGEISYNDLTLTAGASFEEIYFTPETGSFEENDENSKAGTIYNKNLNYSIPKIRSEINAGLKKYEGRKVCALITDFNDTSFLVFPLRIGRKKQIPGTFSSINGILVQMAGKSNKETPVITDLP